MLLIQPRNHPNHPTHYPPNLPQNTNFANIGPILMKLGVVVKNEQQSSNPELFFWSDPPNHPNHPTPYPPNPSQNTNFANFCPFWMKLGEQVNSESKAKNESWGGWVYHSPAHPTTPNAYLASFGPI